MELKTIPIEKVYANWFQPRKDFDKEKIKELAESILSNGLLMPITVKKWRDGKYLVCMGERRWRAHKAAKLKTIQAFVKEYKSDGQFMVESMVENLHRDDLSPTEKGKFCLKIKKQMKLKNNETLSKVLSVHSYMISRWIDDADFRNRNPTAVGKKTDHWLIKSTKGLEDKERVKLIKHADKKGISARKMEEEFIPTYKKADEPTKKALLSGKITVEEAKREPIPEPIQLEETANDVGDDILQNISSLTDNISKILKEMNLEDLTNSKAKRLMTSSGILVGGALARLVNSLKKLGVKPDIRILALIKENGKI